MPTPGELLRRFRVMAVPGAPVTAGVPRDRADALNVELSPLLATLRDAEARGAAMVQAARETADRRRSGGDDEAHRIVAEAQAQAGAVRAEASDARMRGNEEARRTELARAGLEAGRIDRAAAERLPAAVEAVVRAVLPPGAGAEHGR